MSGLLAVGYFLLSIVFSSIIFITWSRLILRYLCVSSLHPIAQIINKLSDPLIKPITNLIKTKRYNRYDWGAFIFLIIIEIIQFITMGFFVIHTVLPIPLIILYTCADLINQPLSLLFYAILIRVILSWVNPYWKHPLTELIYKISDPTLNYVRKYIPTIANLDFSPWVVLVLIKAIQLFISASLPLHLI